jgi:hypothetical protein
VNAPEDGAAGLLDRVREVVPLIAERAATAEEQRKPDDDVIEALKRTGVFKAFVPKQYGGYEIDIELFMDIGVAVSEACASTGWITTFYMEHNWLLGNFAPDLQAEIFSRQPYVLAPGSVNPKDGHATPKGDGYELTNPGTIALPEQAELPLEERPVLREIYRFKQHLCYLLLKKHRTKKQCVHLVRRFLKALEDLSQVGLAQLLAGGVHAFEDELWIVLITSQRNIDDYEFRKSLADCREIPLTAFE